MINNLLKLKINFFFSEEEQFLKENFVMQLKESKIRKVKRVKENFVIIIKFRDFGV